MKTMPVGEFKAKALKVIGQVVATREPVRLTKRGKPIAQVVPLSEVESAPIAGRLSGTLVFEDDILSPLGEEDWEVCS